MNESIYVSREELYDQVWSTPTQHLAAKYGVSDVALGKICKKLSIVYRTGRAAQRADIEVRQAVEMTHLENKLETELKLAAFL